MPISEAKKRANEKWDAANMRQWNVSVPIREAEIVDEYCKAKGIRRTALIRRALKEIMEREPLDTNGQT